MDHSKTDFHKFVDFKVSETGHKIIPVTEALMNERLDEIMEFVNGIRAEFAKVYGWRAESKEYFLNGMVDKWKYSYAIIDENDKFSLIDCVSVYGQVLHQHFIYAASNSRGRNLGKLLLIKICQNGLDKGFTKIETWVSNLNSGSIAFHKNLGWHIVSTNKKEHVLVAAGLAECRDRAYELLLILKKNNA